MYSAALRRTLPALLFLLAVPLTLLLLTQALGSRVREESLALTQQSLQRAAVQCYALEGTYPQDLAYLEERYGVRVSGERFFVDYRYIASNLMPDITVIPVD